MPHSKDPPSSVEPSLTRKEFCAAEKFSIAHYYVLKKAGLAPKETVVGDKATISSENRRKWQRMMQETSPELIKAKVAAARDGRQLELELGDA